VRLRNFAPPRARTTAGWASASMSRVKLRRRTGAQSSPAICPAVEPLSLSAYRSISSRRLRGECVRFELSLTGRAARTRPRRCLHHRFDLKGSVPTFTLLGRCRRPRYESGRDETEIDHGFDVAEVVPMKPSYVFWANTWDAFSGSPFPPTAAVDLRLLRSAGCLLSAGQPPGRALV